MAALVAITAVVAMSRTQVGRDALARRLEAEFAAGTTGRLAIGRLTGNLLRQFVATDVQIVDRNGRSILHADTVILLPAWEELLRRRVVVPRVVLVAPSLRVEFLDGDRTNLGGLFEPDTPSDSLPSRWSFASVHLEVVRGAVHTKSSAPPDSGRSPIWKRLNVERLAFDGLAEHTDLGLQVDVLSASFVDSSLALDLKELSTQFVRNDSSVTVNHGRLALARSRLSFSGRAVLGGGREPRFDLDATADEFVFDEWSGLFENLPFQGTARAHLVASGTAEDIRVSRLDFATGASSLSGRGLVAVYEDSLGFDLAIDQSTLSAADLRSFIPGRADLQTLTFEAVGLSGASRGVVSRFDGALSVLRAQGDVRLTGDAGSLSGAYDIAYEPSYRTRVQVDARFERLDFSAFLGSRVPTTSVNGTVVVDAAGLSPVDLNGNATLRLRPSRIGDRRLEKAEFAAFAVDDDATASLSIIQPAGRLRADLAWRRVEPSTGFIRSSWSHFDIGPFILADSVSSDATGRLDIDFSGRSEAEMAGNLTLVLDSTRVLVGSRETLVPPQLARARLASAFEDGPRLVLDADAARVELSGDVRLPVLQTVLPFWTGALADAVRQVWTKPYPLHDRSADAVQSENSREITTSIRRGDVANLAASMNPGRGFRLSSRIDVRDARLLQGWLGLPSWGGNPSIHFSLDAVPDSVTQSIGVSGDSLWIGGVSVSGFGIRSTSTVRLDAPIDDRLDLRITSRADSVRSGTVSLPDIRGEIALLRGSGRISVVSGSANGVGPVRFSTSVGTLPDRNRFSIDTLLVNARNYAWALDRPAEVEVWQGAVRVSDLSLTSFSEAGRQRISVSGAYSHAPGDSLFVDARGVVLEDITRFASLRQQFGGLLDGRIALTESSGRPVVIGDVRAKAFVLDRRLLGDVRASSRIISGSPDIGLSIHVLPADSAVMNRPDPPAEYRLNELHVDGTVRLPGPTDPGEWNLEIDARHIDLFFLKYIFNESIGRVKGHLMGSGRMGGRYDRPVFDVRLDAREGFFTVPVTGVDYEIEGEVRIDADAIRITRAQVTDSGGGTGIATGSLLFNEYRFFSFDLQADLQRLLFMDTPYTVELPFYGTIRGSGTAFLTGPLANAKLRIPNGQTTDNSELFIPIIDTAAETDDSFIVFADSTGRIPDLQQLARRSNLLARRADVERRFLDGLDMDINLFAPRGSIVHLVIDPLLGDVINAVSTGRMQIQRNLGEFEIFGQLEVEGGDYLFTAGEVFVRRFLIEQGGTITWESDPIDAVLDIPAVYRTRASSAGLDASSSGSSALIPLIVQLQITGRVLSPSVDLRLAVDRSTQNVLGDYQALEARLNNPEKSAEYATSVLLTNSFQLTTDRIDTRSGEQLAFNSVSQLVSSQLNRFLNAAIPNLDVNFGLLGERAQDLDITYGVALRLLDERLIIRGEGVYQGSRADVTNAAAETLQGEFVVEMRLNPAVSVEVFFRREGDILQTSELTNTTGAGLTYQAEFTSWRRFLRRIFGRDS